MTTATCSIWLSRTIRRRLQGRMNRLLPVTEVAAAAYVCYSEWPRLDEGGIDAIAQWADDEPDPRLVVIDTLAMVRGEKLGNEAAYDADYRALSEVRSLASERNLAIVVVHHERKLDAEDPLDQVSGTTGLTGCADTVLVLSRKSQGTILYGRGRDIEEIETAMTFEKETCRWRVLGPASEVHRSEERNQILGALSEAGGPLSVPNIAAGTGLPRNNVDQLLYKMAKAGDGR